jgi:bifunctional DNA-binding transcriptional regulator/antitoxin component of YhaV-PrlF toxin-antitoxin module
MSQVKLGSRKVSWPKKQIVIPEAALLTLELEEGDSLQFIWENGIVRVEKDKP